MTIVATDDTRNLEWRKSNVGSALLQKMGWKEGEGIGKRASSNTTALRALRRQEGLGLGAKIESQGGGSDRSDHFASVLKQLQVHHEPVTAERVSTSAKGKKKKLTLAQNRVNAGHARKIREAKFGVKTAEDLACIFGDRDLKKTDSTSKPQVGESTESDILKNIKRKQDGKKSSKRKKRKSDDMSP